MYIKSNELPVIYGTALNAKFIDDDLTWSFPVPRAKNVLVIDFDLLFGCREDSKTLELAGGQQTINWLRALQQGRQGDDVLAIVIVAKCDKESVQNQVLTHLQKSGLAECVQCVLADDVREYDMHMGGVIFDFKAVHGGEREVSNIFFVGHNVHYLADAVELGIYNYDTKTATSFVDEKAEELSKGLGQLPFKIPKSVTFDQSKAQKKPYIITPLRKTSRGLIAWLFTSYFPSYLALLFDSVKNLWDERDLNSVGHLLKTTFLKTYGFDGYNFITNRIISADGRSHFFRGNSLPLGLMIASFLGFPTRVDRVVDGVPVFTFWQLLRNFLGGWNLFADPGVNPKTASSSKPRKRFEKRGWEIAAIPFKIFIILPLKIITFFFKLFINVLKLFTEILPSLLSYGLLYLMGPCIGLLDFFASANVIVIF